MPDPQPPENPPLPGVASQTESQKLPPFVQVMMTDKGLTVQTNVTDKLIAVALLEGAKFSIMQPDQPLIQKPNGFPNGLLKRMGR